MIKGAKMVRKQQEAEAGVVPTTKAWHQAGPLGMEYAILPT